MSTVEDMGNVGTFMVRTGLVAGSFIIRSPTVLKKDIAFFYRLLYLGYYVYVFMLLCYPYAVRFRSA